MRQKSGLLREGGGAALERGHLAESVGLVGIRQLRPGQLTKSRKQIDGGNERGGVDLARRDLAGPAGDERHVDAAFE